MAGDSSWPFPSSPSTGGGMKRQWSWWHSLSTLLWSPTPPFVCAAPQLWRDCPPLSSPLTFSTHMLSSPSFGTLAQNTVARSFVALAPARLWKKFQPRLSFIYLFDLFVSLFVMLWTDWPLVVVVVVCFKVSNWRRKTLLARQQQSDVLCAHLVLQVSAYFPQSAYVRGTFACFALEKAAVCHLRRVNLHFFPETKIVSRPF